MSHTWEYSDGTRREVFVQEMGHAEISFPEYLWINWHHNPTHYPGYVSLGVTKKAVEMVYRESPTGVYLGEPDLPRKGRISSDKPFGRLVTVSKKINRRGFFRKKTIEHYENFRFNLRSPVDGKVIRANTEGFWHFWPVDPTNSDFYNLGWLIIISPIDTPKNLEKLKSLLAVEARDAKCYKCGGHVKYGDLMEYDDKYRYLCSACKGEVKQLYGQATNLINALPGVLATKMSTSGSRLLKEKAFERILFYGRTLRQWAYEFLGPDAPSEDDIADESDPLYWVDLAEEDLAYVIWRLLGETQKQENRLKIAHKKIALEICRGSTGAALHIIEQAIKLDPNDAVAHYYKAICEWLMDQIDFKSSLVHPCLDDAWRELEEALALGIPKHQHVFSFLWALNYAEDLGKFGPYDLLERGFAQQEREKEKARIYEEYERRKRRAEGWPV